MIHWKKLMMVHNTQTTMYTGTIIDNIMAMGFTEDDGREFCYTLLESADMTDISPDSLANDYPDVTAEIISTLLDDTRKLFEEEIVNEFVFIRSPKIGEQNFKDIVEKQNPIDYYCTICMENFSCGEGNPTLLIHKSKQTSSKCIFCESCIKEWITKSIAKCPNCNETLNHH